MRQTDSSGYTFVPDGAQWRYFKGQAEPSAEIGAWRTSEFNDTGWLVGHTALGFGEGFLATNLSDMRGNYSTIYLRKSFQAASLSAFDRLIIELKYDDGINVWINGHLVFQDNVTSDELPYNATAISAIEVVDFISYDLGKPEDGLVEGTNVIAVQVLNASLAGSSDCFVDVRLTAERDAGGEPPTPVQPQIFRGRPGRYEIEPVWQSAELTEFDGTVKIPASAIRTGRTYRVRCRMKDTSGRWSHWSAPVQFTASEPVAAGILEDLRITELMYNPGQAAVADNDEYEFVELKNIGDETLDLSTVSFVEGIMFDFGGSDVTTLGPGQFVLVVRNKTVFLSRYGAALSDLIAGEYVGKLANNGENIKLIDFWNGTIAEFEYGDGRGWPLSADGAGHSLVPVDSAILSQPVGSLNYGGNWRPSAYIGGSPGADDPEIVAGVVINEFLASGGSSDWIELYNPTDTGVILDDLYLSDDVGDLRKWAVAASVLEPGDLLSFERSGDDLGFGLNRSGEELLLSYLPGTSEDRVVDSIQFAAQEEDVSLGRYPDGAAWWFRLEPSRDASNSSPLADVVIDEVMYHPVDVNDEYIELFNPTDQSIELARSAGTARLTGGIDYVFEPGTVLEAGARLVVVGFDPVVETSRLDAFAAAYGGDTWMPGVTIVGPWLGSLGNAGERLALEMPQASDDRNDPVAWVIVDEVIFGDVSPWPSQADGQGDALQRVDSSPMSSGNDPANWQASPPSPGGSL